MWHAMWMDPFPCFYFMTSFSCWWLPVCHLWHPGWRAKPNLGDSAAALFRNIQTGMQCWPIFFHVSKWLPIFMLMTSFSSPCWMPSSLYSWEVTLFQFPGDDPFAYCEWHWLVAKGLCPTSVKVAPESREIPLSTGNPKLLPGGVPTFQGF